jgi:dsDNA-specific endonuclease/ATPase MutS2
MEELVVADGEYGDLSANYENIGKLMEDKISKYYEILEKLLGNSIQSGEVHDNLAAFVSKATEISGVVSQVANSLRNGNREYVESVDAADEYLY